MNWFKQTLADVVGTQEPDYGVSAIQSVTSQADTIPYTELTKEDLKWKALQVTNVETQTFYIMSDEGKMAWLQMIYNNVAGLRTTCQVNVKVFNHTGNSSKDHLWCSDPLENYGFDADMLSFYADGVAITLNDAGDSYTFKSARNDNGIVNLTFTRIAPGFQVGKDGTSLFGTDHAHPWGEMRHRFWPRCKVEGSIITNEKEYNMAGRGLFIHALQGMKPHHAAAKWNFINLQTPTYSAVMMEFTTPKSYGSVVVNVGGIAKDGEIVYAGATNTVKHTSITEDPQTLWPEPTAVECHWQGKTKDGKDVSAEMTGKLGDRLEREDVMAQVPGLIKSLVGGVVGTRPYIYQYSPSERLALILKVGDDETTEQGTLFSEATFIS